ncbi:YlxR family protein [Actinoallomurus sp. NPDC052308]|uniref:YlxR family protein n=1 Tax=Actinoallomurus sp. NPDC052308 TaxID=3155530 RepID=UPI0034407B71
MAPRRTCVGCRVRTAKSDLLRLVVIEGSIVPDPQGRLPGRGASLHPDLACFELAERRRAFSRAFRLPGPLDISALRRWFETGQGGS